MNHYSGNAFSGNLEGSNNKKFLYSGPKKKDPFGDEYRDSNHHWSYNTNTHNNNQSNYTASKDFDLDDIWSIKKNVNVQANSTKRSASTMDGWDLNAGKGFYSRHGGNSTEMRTTASPTANSNSKNWPRSYSYSNGTANNSNGYAGIGTGSANLNKDFVKISNTNQRTTTTRLSSGLSTQNNSVHQSTFDF